MPKTKAEKRKAKRKIKLKTRRHSITAAARSEKTDFYYSGYEWFYTSGNYDKYMIFLNKAIKIDPDNATYLEQLVRLGHEMADGKIELAGLSRLYAIGRMKDGYLPPFIDLLARNGQYQHALEVAEILLPRLASMRVSNKRKIRSATIFFCRLHRRAHQKKRSACCKESRKPPRDSTIVYVTLQKTAEEVAEFLCGIYSPVFSKLKINKIPQFGILENYPFMAVKDWIKDKTAENSE